MVRISAHDVVEGFPLLPIKQNGMAEVAISRARAVFRENAVGHLERATGLEDWPTVEGVPPPAPILIPARTAGDSGTF